jgi:hypothetical protein
MFKCEYCNYLTDDISNFVRHKKSRKHVTNEQRQNAIITKETYIDLIAYKKLEEENKKLKEHNDKLLNLATQNSNLALENSKTAGKSVRGITYAMKHLNNAHQIKLLEGKEAVKLLTYDNKKSKNDTVETIIIKYQNGLLDKHLGDILIKSYKKEDPTIQSIWGVDATRLHFILKKEEWTSDNCGLKLTEFVIDPFLKSVENMICVYRKTNQQNNCKSDHVLLDAYPRKFLTCEEILVDISKKKLHKQILKYINPHLKLIPEDIKTKSLEKHTSESESSNCSTKKQIKILHPKKKYKKIIVQESDSDSK